MGVDNFDHSDVTGQRRAKRARVLLAAKLQTEAGEIDCRLRDLSRKGALVECAPTPPTGTELTFQRGKISVPARVAWSQPGRIGLEFAYAIDDAEVLVQLGRGSSKPVERFRRPGIREGASEHERKLAAAWGVTVGINLPDGTF